MKLEQLRKVIREEVRAAVNDELQDMLNEAVKIASQPDKEHNLERVDNQVQYNENVNNNVQPKNTNLFLSGNPLQDILNETRMSISNEGNPSEYIRNSIHKPNFASSQAADLGMTGPEPGLDLSKLGFAKKAGEILKKSYEKDKARNV